ncbi:hypothetical protein ACFLVO_01225 [Chloroflexota bacterium]
MTTGLYIGEGLLFQYLEKDGEMGISKSINKKSFRVSDTQMSYRQINVLGNDSLLDDKRRNTRQWRKFSFKELVYLLIISEVKKYGFKQEKLENLWNSFFKEVKGEKKDPIDTSGRTAEVVIGCILMGVEIILTIDSDGNIIFFDPINLITLGSKDRSYIHINVNSIVDQVITGMHKEPLPITYSLRGEHLRTSLTKKEEELLSIIRNREYSSVRVKKKDGDIAIVHAELIKDDSIQMSEVDILKTVEEKDFVEVSITKRDGKVVHFKLEDQYKL